MESIFEVIITSLGVYGPILACFLIIIESVVPILPLCVFITMNFISFGSVVGFIISYLCTIIGCNLAYFLSYLLKNKFNNKVKESNDAKKLLKKFEKISLPSLTLIVSVPFTPAFLINICAGISNLQYKKYLASIIIGKLFMVYFWGFVGLTFIECLTNPLALLKLAILVLVAYIVSIIVKKITKIS